MHAFPTGHGANTSKPAGVLGRRYHRAEGKAHQDEDHRVSAVELNRRSAGGAVLKEVSESCVTKTVDREYGGVREDSISGCPFEVLSVR